MGVALDDCVYLTVCVCVKGLGLFSLIILFTESHVHSVDGSQRQRTSKRVQETGLQLPIIGIMNMFSFNI